MAEADRRKDSEERLLWSVCCRLGSRLAWAHYFNLSTCGAVDLLLEGAGIAAGPRKMKCRSLSRFALSPNPSSGPLHYGPADRQPDTRARNLMPVQTAKNAKDLFRKAGIEALAVVTDREVPGTRSIFGT